MNNMGLIHIYCGDGKGKTSSAIGVSIRALSNNYKVLFIQFLKDGDSSEIERLKRFNNIKIITGKGPKGFTFYMTDEDKEKVKNVHDYNLKAGIELCYKKEVDLIILDEVIGAMNLNLLDNNLLLDFLQNKPENLEVIMTGRDPDKKLIDISNYVSEIKKIKHPFDKGIAARRGIDM